MKAGKCIGLWRKRLNIDPKWEIDVCYIESDPDPTCEGALIVFDDKHAEYWSVTLLMTRKLVEDPDFHSQIGSYISHELDHLRMWQYASFAKNLARGDTALEKELEKLEEQIVQQNENIWGEVKWPKG